MTGAGIACPNGAQDTPNPGSLTAACQSTGDAQGNIGFWAPAGTYDYTVCIGYTCLGPYTVTLGGSGGGFVNPFPGPLVVSGSSFLALTPDPYCAFNLSAYGNPDYICELTSGQLMFYPNGPSGSGQQFTFTSSTAPQTFSNAGAFTTGQMNLYVQSLLGGCNPTTLFQTGQGGVGGGQYATDAFTPCVIVPSGTTVHQVNAVDAEVQSLCNSLVRTVCNPVALYGAAFASANNAAAWGGNSVASDVAGSAGVQITGWENDVNVFGNQAAGWVQGIISSIFGTGTMPTCGGCSFGNSVVSASPATIAWPHGYYVGVGAVKSGGSGLWIDHLYSTGSSPVNSPFITLSGYDGTNSHSATLNADSTGDLILTPASGAGVAIASLGPAAVKLTPGTYAILIAAFPCNSSNEGMFAAVTDSSTATYNATVAGSGSNHIPVYCNGTNWVAH